MSSTGAAAGTTRSLIASVRFALAFSGAIHRAPCVAAKLQSNKGQRPSSRYHRRAERNCTGDEDGRGDIRRGSTAAAIRKERLYVYVDTPRVTSSSTPARSPT